MSSFLKKCKVCLVDQTLDNFNKDYYKDKTYIRGTCKRCQNIGFSQKNKAKNVSCNKQCIGCGVSISYRNKTNRCRSCINFGYTSKKWLNSHGYVLIYHNKKRLLEHRVIMEDKLGRKLFPHETVHHKNGNRTDNKLENLELWSTFQPRGQKIEDKIKYAKEILAIYDPTALNKS